MKNNHFQFTPEYTSGIKIGSIKFDSPNPIEFFVPDTVATKDFVLESVSEFDRIILKSSTEGSSKKFMITVDDNGTLTTKEIV